MGAKHSRKEQKKTNTFSLQMCYAAMTGQTRMKVYNIETHTHQRSQMVFTTQQLRETDTRLTASIPGQPG